MEIILLDNVDGLGTVGQTVKVKDGYARNYLLPKNLACKATKKNLSFYRTRIEAEQKKLAKAKDGAEKQAELLNAVSLTFLRKTRDEESRLFGSVTNADVAEALEQKGFEIDKRRVVLSEPIKKLGEFKAQVRLHPEVTAEIAIQVQPEEEAEDAG